MESLDGKLALVTGASRGIGRAIALALGRMGASIAGTATSDAGATQITSALEAQSVKGRGYVLNVFVEPSHRKQGIARALMDRADREFASRGVAFAILHATKMGRPLYEQLGWSATSEMAKSLSAGDQK